MIHPSYYELIDQVNKNMGGSEDDPIITSRYSIVIAAAKRARQLIDIASAKEEKEKLKNDTNTERKPVKQVNYVESKIPDAEHKKPLSVAVEELMRGDVKIVLDDDEDDEEIDSLISNFSENNGEADSESESEEDEPQEDSEE